MQELTEIKSRFLYWGVLKASFSTHLRRIQQQTTCCVAQVRHPSEHFQQVHVEFQVLPSYIATKNGGKRESWRTAKPCSNFGVM